MNREISVYASLLEKRAQMLRAVSAALQNSQNAVVELNLAQIYRHTAEQENLCAGLQKLDQEIRTVRQAIAVLLRAGGSDQNPKRLLREVDETVADRLRLAVDELAAVQAEVRRLNRVQSGLLRRSRKSIGAMTNFMADCLETYRAAAASQKRPVGVEA
jgi:hypothetical protein